MPKTRTPVQRIHLTSPNVRRLLALDLPGLPIDVARGEDTIILAALAAIWLDGDERIKHNERAAESAHVSTY